MVDEFIPSKESNVKISKQSEIGISNLYKRGSDAPSIVLINSSRGFIDNGTENPNLQKLLFQKVKTPFREFQ